MKQFIISSEADAIREVEERVSFIFYPICFADEHCSYTSDC
jgi:hypothetical protein